MSRNANNQTEKMGLYQTWRVIFRQLIRINIDKQFILPQILFFITVSISLVKLAYSSVPLSCQLVLIQYGFFTFVITSIALRKSRAVYKMILGGMLGIEIGVSCAIVDTIITNIHYYYLGGREAAALTFGHALIPISIETIKTGIISGIAFGTLEVTMSMISGLLAGIIPLRYKHTDQLEQVINDRNG